MKIDFAVLDLLNWIRRWFHHAPKAKTLLYRHLKRWPCSDGNLHLIERDRLPGEQPAIVTLVWFARRDTKSIPLDLWFELRRSRLPGFTHEFVIVENEHYVKGDIFVSAQPILTGHYAWGDRKGRSTKRRNFLIQEFEIINQFEVRDRDAVLIVFAVARRRCLQVRVDWAGALSEESKLVLGVAFHHSQNQLRSKLAGGKVSGYLLDQDKFPPAK